jgi:hypothetical protein
MDILGVSHIHSHYSYDAKSTLAELRSALQARGVRFALMAEHTDHLTPQAAVAFIEECRRLSDEAFVFVPGFEVPYLGTHILVLGANAFHQGGSPSELLAQWHADGALLVLAHPHRNGYRLDSFLKEHLHGIEIWNSQYDGIHAPRRAAWKLLDGLAVPLHAYACLDLHRLSQINGPRIAMQVSTLHEADIMARMRQGAFSIRQGATIILSDGTLFAGNPRAIRMAGAILPAMVGLLRRGSSMLAKIGIRSFPLKKWIRAHV